ncbi:MAG: SDR family oxidoreductase [Acidimicrobiales bacterium]
MTVHSVQPGLYATDRLSQLYQGDLSTVAAHLPTGEVGRPQDFGAMVAFLCSDATGFVTGAAIPVDGGAYQGLL